MKKDIIIKGIRTHNLKDIDIILKRNKLNLIIGPSGSGKSSLAYDTIAQIGQHELMSMFADNIKESTYRVKLFQNMITDVPIKQTNTNNNLRSTIGTYFGLNRSNGLIYSVVLGVTEDVFVLNKDNNTCEICHGIGTEDVINENRIINYNKSINENPFRCFNRYKDFYSNILEKYCFDCNIDGNKTFKELSPSEKNTLLYGVSSNKYSIRYKKNNSYSRRTTRYYGVMTGKSMLVNHKIADKYYSKKVCSVCRGKKYSQEHEKYKIMNLSIGDFMLTPFSELSEILNNIARNNTNDKISFTINLVKLFVDKTIELNLGHLFFHRAIPTLSGGELQRLKMIQVFNTQLSDLLIVLDEPLASLSGKEKSKLYKNIIKLTEKYTVIVVDHSEIFIKSADNIIALGKGGGDIGGFIINSGGYIKSQRKTYVLDVPKIEREITIKIDNNIYEYKGIDIKIAENCMNLIKGPSGVSKSTMLREYLPQYFDGYVYINQKPLLSNKNSSVASLLGVSTMISTLYERKFFKEKGFFSNLTGNKGACPICKGSDIIEYGSDKQILIKLGCKECSGTGFNKGLKKYKINDKSIFDIWEMTIDEGIEYYKDNNQKIYDVLENVKFLMLGHLKIGQHTSTLSGGENVRMKILKSLKTKANFIGIDEPFKGLNTEEIYRVASFLNDLRKNSKTIIVTDHNEYIDKYFSKCIKIGNKNGILIEELSKDFK